VTLSDALSRTPVRGRGHSCTVGFLLNELARQDDTDDPGPEYRAVVAALSDPQWTSTDLERTIIAEGFFVNVRHLRPHRTGLCTSANCSDPNIGMIRR
jgi:hypothetical protein